MIVAAPDWRIKKRTQTMILVDRRTRLAHSLRAVGSNSVEIKSEWKSGYGHRMQTYLSLVCKDVSRIWTILSSWSFASHNFVNTLEAAGILSLDSWRPGGECRMHGGLILPVLQNCPSYNSSFLSHSVDQEMPKMLCFNKQPGYFSGTWVSLIKHVHVYSNV